MAFGIATVKVIISAMSAYAIVYFRFRLATPIFWLIFITLLVPLEVRILPSYQIVSDLNLTNSYTGLVLPLVASATATFFFRQFYMSVPEQTYKTVERKMLLWLMQLKAILSLYRSLLSLDRIQFDNLVIFSPQVERAE